MNARTVNIVETQAVMSTQLGTVVEAVNAQISAAGSAAASRAAAADEAAASRAAAADAQIQTALNSITASVSRQVTALQTNVTNVIAAAGGSGAGSSPKNAGTSCKAIKSKFSNSNNGNYWVKNPLGGESLVCATGSSWTSVGS